MSAETAGISRSGRVRKKSAKLKEMEKETPGNPIVSKIVKSNSSHNTSSEEDRKPLKKKLKFKLSLGGENPTLTTIDVGEEEQENTEENRATIPPLKIPKSKIVEALTPLPEKVKSEHSKSKREKHKKNIKDSEKEIVKVDNADSVNQNITETPVIKVSKSRKREHESAANKLFRQITSGVSVDFPKNKRKRHSTPQTTRSEGTKEVEEFGEASLIIDSEPTISKPKKVSRKSGEKREGENKRRKLKKGVIAEDGKVKKKRSIVTAYMLWGKEHRSKIQQTNPGLDFSGVSKKLGEVWQSLPKNEKMQWKRKAQKLSGKGSSIISTGKSRSLSGQVTNKKTLSTNIRLVSLNNHSNDETSALLSSNEDASPIGTAPIDVAAHLKILGESLSLIGQRLKEHSGQIAVSGSLSVLLDSTLCALGPLLCLTSLDPRLDGCDQTIHKKTLDNIGYIMPGI